MDKPTVATLPFNDASSSSTLLETENPVLSTVDYSDKSFIVFGEATKTYKRQLLDLGGKFNMYLKERPGFSGGAAWLFFTKSKPTVYKFLNQVNSGETSHHKEVVHQDSQTDSGLNLPTVVAPVKGTKYQYVKWKVFKPSEGMKVTIKAGGASVTGEVLQTESHNNVVDTAYINLNGNTSKLVISNSYWQVLGYMVEHRVIFTPLNEEADKNDVCDDVAEI